MMGTLGGWTELNVKREGILVVGSDSSIGRDVMARLQDCGELVWGTTRRPECVDSTHLYLDLSGNDLASWRCPKFVTTAIMCAGVTKIEACERDPIGTGRVNVLGTIELAGSLVRNEAFVIYLSTNQVFDGSIPFRPADDPPCPLTEYGRQKVEVEKYFLSLGTRASAARLTKVVKADMPLLAEWVESLQRKEAIYPFSDMVMAPVPVSFVVDVLLRIARLRLPGVLQVSGPKDVTYAEVARHIARRIGADDGLVHPVNSAEMGISPVCVPAHTTLKTDRLRRELGLEPPGVWDAIDLALAS